MLEITKILTPAEDFSLISPYYARLGLNISSTSSETLDEQIEMLIRWSSDEISHICNRVFARERVEDTYRDIGATTTKIYLSHCPIAEIESVVEADATLTKDTDYQVETSTGLLKRLGSTAWSEPVVVTYTGGYRLPYEAPEALQQAMILMVREAYYATLRGDATIRMVGHKEARVIYFDPAQQARALMGSGSAGSAGSPARRSSEALLKKFTRYFV